MERILKEILAFTVIICIVLAGTQTVHASNGPTYTVWPTGHDDTTNIQGALNKCTTGGPSCTVQLVKGTYYIGQITVYGFEGSFVGMGQGVTIIQALPNLPSPTAIPFYTGTPGSSNLWPDLFAFVNGAFSISRMTITDPYENPTEGYVFELGHTSYTALDSAILITGAQEASASIDHVTVIGASGDAYGTNMFNGIVYAGYILPPAYNLISGTFSVTNSVFNTVETGPWATDVDGATVTVCYNTAINDPGWTYALGDFYNSKATVCGNQGSAFMGLAAIAVDQDFNVPPPTGVSPSTVYITGNYMHVSQNTNAVVLYDGYDSLRAVVSGNTFTTDSTCTSTLEDEGLCYNYPTVWWGSSVVVSYSLINVVVSQNTIFGGGTGSNKIPANGVYVTGGPGQVTGNMITGSYYGVWVDAATGVQAAAMHSRLQLPWWGHHGLISGNTITPSHDVPVTGNVIKNSAWYGIALTNGSSDNVIAGNLIMNSGVDDLYWDGTGTGNVWKADVCQTSSPPGLCAAH